MDQPADLRVASSQVRREELPMEPEVVAVEEQPPSMDWEESAETSTLTELQERQVTTELVVVGAVVLLLVLLLAGMELMALS
jgi:hypothetical protein